MASRVLVTGGAGFIGSHLVRALLMRGESVRVLDNLSTGSVQNLAEVTQDIQFVRGDLRDRTTCLDACQSVDAVFHLGALGSVPRSIEDPHATNDVNANGTMNLLDAARKAGVRRLVFSSSSSVYGDTPVLPKREDMRLSPRSPYAVSKMAAEAYCRAFTLSYGLETVALRYFNVFGPRQNPNSQYAAVIPKFISALLNGQTPVIHGNGLQSRDFTYVSNVVEANILAASASGVVGEVFNIACGEQITVACVLSRIARLLQCPYEPVYVPTRAGDILHSRADITAACERLGYRPQILFSDGLEQTVPAYRDRQITSTVEPSLRIMAVV